MTTREVASPWPAMWALVLGFFMILVDATIVSIATPAIMAAFGADVDAVVWVTSAYLLAYAVPLLITGRLGDRYGPKRMYLIGLAVFTVASLWCGLTGSIGGLVVARVVQGLGASILSPQTMAVITRTFPAHQRGRAMSLWGAVAGVAVLVGPIAGGLLVDGLGWQWIFFVNVPVGIVGFVLAVRLVPHLGTAVRRFDLVGVALSAVGMFLLVFGIQEGQAFAWGPAAWALIVGGLAVLALFLAWQTRAPEPLIPLALFHDRNFSLANVAITTLGLSVTAQAFPITLYAQGVRGLSPTGAALLLAPSAVISTFLAPYVGRLTDRAHPRWIAVFGLSSFAVSLVWFAAVMRPETPIWQLLLPTALMGVGSGFMWAPIGTAATRNLPMDRAGAGAGVYNTTRQVGAVLGSAGIAALMQTRLSAVLPGGAGGVEAGVAQLPPALHGAFSTAMAQSLLLPAGVLLVGIAAVLGFALPRHLVRRTVPEPAGAESGRT